MGLSWAPRTVSAGCQRVAGGVSVESPGVSVGRPWGARGFPAVCL